MSFDVDNFGIRNTERYGGCEAVGSALWLEHSSGLVIPTADGEDLITPEDLVADEADFKQYGYIQPRTLDKETLDGLPTTQLLRNYLLPALPVRISGDTAKPKLSLETEVVAFNAPRDFTRGAGVIAVESFGEEAEKDFVPTFSVRFVPREGEVETMGIYPYSAIHERYTINAFEVDNRSLRAVIGGRVLVECFKQHEEDLPPQIAPHQF